MTIYLGVFFLLCSIGLLFFHPRNYVGAARIKEYILSSGNIRIPDQRTMQWEPNSTLTENVLKHWAGRDLSGIWNQPNKGKAARVMLARYTLGQDLDEVNSFLIGLKPWGSVGSSWQGNHNGDYDFELPALTTILYQFGDKPDILYPEARTHLLETLLTVESGKPRPTVPNSFGLIGETENHVLMTEGSRYLKNRWLALHGNSSAEYDNERNGLTEWLWDYLNGLHSQGLYEFNSNPYCGFTITAIMNLQAFGCFRISASAEQILDRLNWNYALGSLSFRRFPPFRRSFGSARVTELSSDGHTALIKVWMSMKRGAEELRVNDGLVMQHALFAAVLPYRLPDKTAHWVLRKPERYFVRMGHGPDASPEIYSGGSGYLLTSGGVYRGKRQKVVPRPTTLFVSDSADQLGDVLHLYGRSEDFAKWNNTGVHIDFACAAGPVHIPENWKIETAKDLWSIYQPQEKLAVAVHSTEAVGIVALFHTDDVERILKKVADLNRDEVRLSNEFHWPNGSVISYDLNAGPDRWVICSLDGDPVDRHYDRWALMDYNRVSVKF